MPKVTPVDGHEYVPGVLTPPFEQRKVAKYLRMLHEKYCCGGFACYLLAVGVVIALVVYMFIDMANSPVLSCPEGFIRAKIQRSVNRSSGAPLFSIHFLNDTMPVSVSGHNGFAIGGADGYPVARYTRNMPRGTMHWDEWSFSISGSAGTLTLLTGNTPVVRHPLIAWNLTKFPRGNAPYVSEIQAADSTVIARFTLGSSRGALFYVCMHRNVVPRDKVLLLGSVITYSLQ
jgi:hypothetical protein